MDSDDSSRLALAGAAMRAAGLTHLAPASVPLSTDSKPTALDAARQGAFVRR